jgi:hypothetical protein
VHHSADITGFQSLGRKISGQDHTVVFVDAHSSKGYAVIRRGATSPLSICQTVLT